MNEEQLQENLKFLSDAVNRSLNQTKFLFELCDNDFRKLFKLEAALQRTSTCNTRKMLRNVHVYLWSCA